MLDYLATNFHFIVALTVFVGSLVMFFFDKIDKTLVSLGWAMILILTGVLSPLDAAKSIDIETLVLLFWLMLVVWIAFHSWLFAYINMQIAKKSNWSPKVIFFLFIALITTASFVLNNATVVLLTVPIAIALARWLSLDGKLLVVLLAAFSNIWWTLTLIGDPPNTLIWVKANLPFMDFIYNMWIPLAIMTALIIGYLLVVYKKAFTWIKNDLTKTFISKLIIERISYKYADKKMDKYVAWVAVLIVIITVILLVVQPQISELATNLTWLSFEFWMFGFIWVFAWILGSLLVTKKVNFLHIMKEVEWDTLIFFAWLFVQVWALEKVWFLHMITEQIWLITSLPLLIVVIVWWIWLASTVINNIPFVALMIPVIMDLQKSTTLLWVYTPDQLYLLWWALALWACLGWNWTIIWSASWVIACDIAKKQWMPISFAEFAKIWMPITIISLFVSSAYLLVALYFTK